MNEQSIREELAKVLKEDPENYNKILELSSSLAKFDSQNIRFSVDAGVIDRLGTELVARQETAVSELVKNSYDADATEVILKFKNSDSTGGTLIVEDNGLGMTREQLINGFMRISSTEKVKNPNSERYNRKRSGQKGIGRFAVQRLGKRLTIITQTKESETALELVIEWGKYKGNSDLVKITNKVQSIEKQKTEGTTLIIEQLRDRWSQASIKRIYRYVSIIIQPFPLSEIKREEETTKENLIVEQNTIEETGLDPGFKTVLKKITGTKEITIADASNMIYKYALATIDGSIDDTGIGIYAIESKQLQINEVGEIGSSPDDNTTPFDQLRNIKFKAYYYVYNAGLVPKMYETSIKSMAKKFGGIRLYRNGFRVLPYGEPGNDWLKLDASIRQRSILPVHGNTNFFGFVEIKDTEEIFNETSSREGLIENEALIQLQNFLYRALITGVLKTAEARNIKLVSGQKKEGKLYEQIDVRIKNIAHTLEQLDAELEKEENNTQVKIRRKKRLAKLKKEIKKVAELQKEDQTKQIKERSMLRVLSSVGITIGQFIHEVKDYVINMESDIIFLLDKLKADTLLFDRVLILDKNVTTFKSYTSYFDRVISQNVIRELRPIELHNAILRFWDSIKHDAEKGGITFLEPQRNGYYLYTTPMHPSEWSSILFNFYTNAKKAIKRTKKQGGKMYVECGFAENNIYLEFSDTGDGISPENEEKIFDEFFTTTSSNNFDDIDSNNEVTGTGLGLKIVKDIVSSYRGSIQVVSPKAGFNTCLRIEINSATEKELDNYGL